MDIDYLIKDYRLEEALRDETGIHLAKAPSIQVLHPDWTDEEIDAWWNSTEDDDEPYFWAWDGDKALFGVPNSLGTYWGGERPDPTTHSFGGRKFVVWYYHDGQPLTIREIDS